MISHSDRSVLFNLSAAAIAELGTKAAQFATIIVIARTLGPADFGIVGAAWALYQLAVPVVQSAPEIVGIRGLAADRPNALRWITVIGTLKAGLALIALVVLTLYAAAIYGPDSRSTDQVAIQAIVLVGIALTPAWAARSFQRTDLYVIPRISQAVGFLVLIIVLLSAYSRPLVVPMAEAVSWCLGVFVACRSLRCLLPVLSIHGIVGVLRHSNAMRNEIVRNFKTVLDYALGGVAATALWWLPILIVETTVGREAGGYAVAAVRLVTTAIVGLQLCLQAYLPVLSKYHASDPEKFRGLVSGLTFYSMLFHMIAGAALFVLAAPMMNLVFGASYEAAIPLLRILSVMLAVAGPNTALTYGLIAADHHRGVLLFAVLGGMAVVAGQTAGVVISNTAEGFSCGIPFYAGQSILLMFYAKRHHILGREVLTRKRLVFRNVRAFLLER